MSDNPKVIPLPKSRVADSMDAAVAILADAPDESHRLDTDEMKRAKVAGCPAFRGSRVYVDELTAWWDEHAETLPTGNSELDSITIELAREKLRKARFANEVEEGRYMKREDEAQKILALGLSLKTTLRKRLLEEYPPRLANRSREEIAEIMMNLFNELCVEFQEDTKRWVKK